MDAHCCVWPVQLVCVMFEHLWQWHIHITWITWLILTREAQLLHRHTCVMIDPFMATLYHHGSSVTYLCTFISR